MISPLELAANVVMAVSILLAGRNSIHTWWTGIVGCILFGVLFYQAKLFADVILQLFFVGTSVLGYRQWRFGNAGKPKAISPVGKRTLLKIVPLGLIVVSLYGLLLHRFTDAYAPFWDSGILVFSVVAQVLMMRRNVECWIFWLAVNSIAVPLYAGRDLYLTSGLYACYWIHAVVAVFYWQRLLAAEKMQKIAKNGFGKKLTDETG